MFLVILKTQESKKGTVFNLEKAKKGANDSDPRPPIKQGTSVAWSNFLYVYKKIEMLWKNTV